MERRCDTVAGMVGWSKHLQHGKYVRQLTARFNGLVVMISVSHVEFVHTEGLQFDPGLNHFLSISSLLQL